MTRIIWSEVAFLALIGVLVAWSRYVMPPLQNYYLMDYLDSTAWQSLPYVTTKVVWLYKTAPKQNAQPISEVDVISAPGGGNSLPVKLSPSAIADGWRGIGKRTQRFDSAQQKQYLKALVYGGHSLWRVFLLPLLGYAAAVLFLFGIRSWWKKRSRPERWDEWRTKESSFSWEKVRFALTKKRVEQPNFIERKMPERVTKAKIAAPPLSPPPQAKPEKQLVVAPQAAPPPLPAPAAKPREAYVWDESKWID